MQGEEEPSQSGQLLQPAAVIKSNKGGGKTGPLQFQEKSKTDESSIWHFFLREENGQFAQCKDGDCRKILKTGGGTTSVLHSHLKAIHGKSVKQNGASKKIKGYSLLQPGIKDYYASSSEKSLKKILARMTAKDGIPFSKFVTSTDLRRAINSMGLDEKLPASVTTIKKHVVQYSIKVREEQRLKIQDAKSTGAKFSIIFDEWTSARNRRYVNIMLRSSKETWWNLGLVRVKGSLTAEKNLKLVSERLERYNLKLKEDIICLTTDGTSMMTKIGRLTPTLQQLCFAHGVQLAVLDVLYPKRPDKSDAEENTVVDNESEEDDDVTSDQDEGGFSIANGQDLDIIDVSDENIQPLVKKVRQVVKLFRKSPKKNEILQKLVKEEHGNELKLILDVKTRWNSLLDMMERLYMIRMCVQEALLNVNAALTFSDDEISQIYDLVQALRPIKVTVEALCRRDATLLTADASLNFTLRKLQLAGSMTSMKLYDRLVQRIMERRTVYSGVLSYLHYGSLELPKDSDGEKYDDVFNIPAKRHIGPVIQGLVDRLKGSKPSSQQAEVLHQEINSDNAEFYVTLRKKKKNSDMQIELNEVLQGLSSNSHQERPTEGRNKSTLDTVKKEMDLFEAGGSRGYYLKMAYDYIKSIPATSVESERAFSAAGYFCNKIRSSLNDDTIDELCFLRTHFQLSG